MSMVKRLSRRMQEKVVWDSVAPFLEIPNTETREGMRAYKAAQRQVVAKVSDEAFMRDFERQRQSFTEFLLTHRLEPYPPLREFLNRDFTSFTEPKRKKR